MQSIGTSPHSVEIQPPLLGLTRSVDLKYDDIISYAVTSVTSMEMLTALPPSNIFFVRNHGICCPLCYRLRQSNTDYNLEIKFAGLTDL